MTRHTKPEFSIAPEDANNPDSQARVERLALLSTIYFKQPEVTKAILGSFALSDEITAKLGEQPLRAVLQGKKQLDELPYSYQVEYATALVLQNDDDYEAVPDNETKQAMRAAIGTQLHEGIEGVHFDRRLVRLKVLAGELFRFANTTPSPSEIAPGQVPAQPPAPQHPEAA